MAHLAHLSLWGGALRYSGDHAQGDEFLSPVCAVIDVGRSFTITWDGKLFLTGEGKARYQEFSAASLLKAARDGWFDLTLLWDAFDPEEKEMTCG